MKLLTTGDLDQMQCGNPDCTHEAHDTEPMYLHAVCHMDEALTVAYDRGRGALLIHCAVCDQFVAAVAVRKGGERGSETRH